MPAPVHLPDNADQRAAVIVELGVGLPVKEGLGVEETVVIHLEQMGEIGVVMHPSHRRQGLLRQALVIIRRREGQHVTLELAVGIVATADDDHVRHPQPVELRQPARAHLRDPRLEMRAAGKHRDQRIMQGRAALAEGIGRGRPGMCRTGQGGQCLPGEWLRAQPGQLRLRAVQGGSIGQGIGQQRADRCHQLRRFGVATAVQQSRQKAQRQPRAQAFRGRQGLGGVHEGPQGRIEPFAGRLEQPCREAAGAILRGAMCARFGLGIKPRHRRPGKACKTGIFGGALAGQRMGEMPQGSLFGLGGRLGDQRGAEEVAAIARQVDAAGGLESRKRLPRRVGVRFPLHDKPFQRLPGLSEPGRILGRIQRRPEGGGQGIDAQDFALDQLCQRRVEPAPGAEKPR